MLRQLIQASDDLAATFVQEFSPDDQSWADHRISHLPTSAPTQQKLEECIVAFGVLVAHLHRNDLFLRAGFRANRALHITRNYLLRGEAVGRCVGRQDELVRMMRHIHRAWPEGLFSDAHAGLLALTEHLDLPTYEDLVARIRAVENDPWTRRYRNALTGVALQWPDATKVAAEIGALTESIYSISSVRHLERRQRIARACERASKFRARSIVTLESDDRPVIEQLFRDVLDTRLGFHDRNPSAVGQALHLMAPEFFPWWDASAEHSTADWGSIGHPAWDARPDVATQYVRYCFRAKRFVTEVGEGCPGLAPRPNLVMHAQYQHALAAGPAATRVAPAPRD